MRARTALAQCTTSACPAVIRTQCADWLADLEARMPTIVLGARDVAGHDIARVRVMFDGRELTTVLDGRPVEVDPGSHRLRFDAEGHRGLEMDLVVRTGEKNRLVSAVLEPEHPSPPGPAEDAPTKRSLVLPIVAGSFAAAFFTADAALVLSATSDLHALERSPCARTRTCDPDDIDSVQTRLDVSKVFLLLSALSAGVCVATVLWPMNHGARSSRAASVVAMPAAGGALAALRGSF